MSAAPLPYAMRDAARRRDRVLRRMSAWTQIRDLLVGSAIVVMVVAAVVLRLTGDL